MKSYKSPNNKISSIIVLFLIFISILLFVFGSYHSYTSYINEKRLNTFNYSESPFYHDKSPTFGTNKDYVTIVHYLEPDSIDSKNFHNVFVDIFNTYSTNGLFVIRYLNNNPNSEYAIKLLEASRSQYNFRNMLNFLFENFSVWSSHYDNNPQKLWEIMPDIINKKQLKEDFNNIDVSDIILIDSENAKTLDIQKSPTIFINSIPLESFTYKDFSSLIKETYID